MTMNTTIDVTGCEVCPFGKLWAITFTCLADKRARCRSHMLPLDCPLKQGDIIVRLWGGNSDESQYGRAVGGKDDGAVETSSTGDADRIPLES
jgi:hypothetical protein